MSGWCRPEIMILTMKVKCIGSLIGRSEAAVRMKAQVKGISLILRVIFTSQQNIRSAITVKNYGADTFVPLEMTVPKFRGEEHVRWDGRARFKGQVMAPACTLAMEAAWREIDMGTTPLRDLLPVQRINSCYGYTTVILQVQESRSTR